MKKKLGQYFTPPSMVKFMVQLAKLDSQSSILEPSCGDGAFLKDLTKQGFHNITAYEIDPCLAQLHPKVQCASFVSANITERFDLVIGNPPYIRWKHLDDSLKTELIEHPLWQQHCNKLCDYLHIFILRSIELLKIDGQLIFICPEYWMNTTHSQGLRDYMLQHGHFERIYQFQETPIFSDANVACVVFKYVKQTSHYPSSIPIWKYEHNRRLNAADLQGLNRPPDFHCSAFEIEKNWLIAPQETVAQLQAFEQVCTPEKRMNQYVSLGEVCDIANGMVSGLDKAFQWLEDKEELTPLEQDHLLQVVKA
ncbi:MAG: N-6 DNA methylase, partial [Bacteroidota bacterium]